VKKVEVERETYALDLPHGVRNLKRCTIRRVFRVESGHMVPFKVRLRVTEPRYVRACSIFSQIPLLMQGEFTEPKMIRNGAMKTPSQMVICFLDNAQFVLLSRFGNSAVEM